MTLDDGTSAVYRMHSTEFFRREFQAEGEREDDDVAEQGSTAHRTSSGDVAEQGSAAHQTSSGDVAEYRLITTEDNESVLLGRKGPDESEWSMVGEVVEAARADATEN